MKTPEWAQRNECGQFNGYIAFPCEDYDLLWEDNEWGGDASFPQWGLDDSCEVTLNQPSVTLDKLSDGICPITEIPKEAADLETFCLFGFDTCHINNSWEKDTYEHVREVTLDWFDNALEYLKQAKDDMQYRE